MSLLGSAYKKIVELRKGLAVDITSSTLIPLTNPASTEDFTVDKATFEGTITVSASNTSFNDSTLSTGSSTVQGALDVVGGQAFLSRYGTSTGWLSGGLITVNGGDTGKFDFTSGAGLIVDATDPTNITPQSMSWNGATAVTPTFIATNAVTFVAIDANGDLAQSATFPVGGDLRGCVQLGALVHGNNVDIDGTSDFVSAVPYQIAPSLTDLIIALGVIQINGNDFSGSGNTNLKFEKSAGTDFYFGIDAKADPNNPNNISNILQNEPDITFSWRDGSGGFNTKFTDAITAGVFDDGTGGASDPTGTVTTNNWTNVRIKYSPDADTIFIEYGDATYNSAANAVLNARGDFYGDNPSFAGVPIRTFLSIRGAASNLDITGDGVFTQTTKFGLI